MYRGLITLRFDKDTEKVTLYNNANGKVVMVDEKTNYDAHIGDELSRYEGMLNDEYGISIVVEVLDDGEYDVSAYKKRNGCTTTIFHDDEAYDDDVLDVRWQR